MKRLVLNLFKAGLFNLPVTLLSISIDNSNKKLAAANPGYVYSSTATDIWVTILTVAFIIWTVLNVVSLFKGQFFKKKNQ